jgi:hypothetical protein
MPDDTCSVDGCDKPPRTRDLCYAHYMRAWRYGSPTYQHPPTYRDLTGQRFGLLTVLRREDHKWLCLCDCGAETLVRVGDLNRGTATSCGNRRHRWADDAGYSAAHGRVRHRRGSASLHLCVDCGKQAKHWSYDRLDENERTSDLPGPSLGAPYSLDPSHYVARCVPCHKTFDLAHINAEG